jgi:hypothetical protein
MEAGDYCGYNRLELVRLTGISVRSNNDRTKLFKSETLPAYIELLCSLAAWNGDLATARKRSFVIRTLGAPLSQSVRSQHAISARLNLGDVFFSSLTGLGRTDPKKAAEAMSYWPCHLLNNLMRLNLCVSDRSLAYLKIDTRVCCSAAVALAQTLVSVPSAKMFALEGCNMWRCSCSFDRGMIDDPALAHLPAGATVKVKVDADHWT